MHVTVVQLVMFHGNSTLNNNILISLGGRVWVWVYICHKFIVFGGGGCPKTNICSSVPGHIT